MDSAEYAADGNLRLTFATWVMALHASGVVSSDEGVAEVCGQLLKGEGEPKSLVDLLNAHFSDGADVAHVKRAADALYPTVRTDLGEGGRQDRLARVRGYQFGRQLPWLARIWERDMDGCVGPSWLLIEQVTDRIRTMDPNPWNDIDEERLIAVGDFQVLWELDGCTSIAVS